LAFGVLSTIHDAVTGIGTGTLKGDTGFAFTNGVGGGATANDGIALVGTLSDDRDAGITLTCGVFIALNAGSALIGAGAVLVETGSGCGTDEVAGAGAVRVCCTSIGTRAGKSNAGIVLTSSVGDSAAALGGFTETGAGAGEEHTDISLALRVLVAPYFRGTGIGAGAGDRDALVTRVAFVVELSATTKDRIARVGTGAGDDETGGVVGVAFGVGFTTDCLVTLVCTRTALHKTGVFRRTNKM
jgi:hypothetical protein